MGKSWTLIPREVHSAAATLPRIEAPERRLAARGEQRTLVPLDVAPTAAAQIWNRSGRRGSVGLIPRALFASEEAAEEAARARAEATDRTESQKRFGPRTLISFAALEGSGTPGRMGLSFGPAPTDAILRAMLDQPTMRWHTNRLKMTVSIAVYAAALGTLVVVPLFFTETVELGGKYGVMSVVPRRQLLPQRRWLFTRPAQNPSRWTRG